MENKKDYLFWDFPDFEVTEKIKKDIIKHPQKYLGCDVRIKLGMFYTEEELEKN